MSGVEKSRETIRVNGRERPHRPGTLFDLLAALGLDSRSSGIAVAINGEIVPRGGWERREIRPGDEIEVVGAVQGG